MRHHNIKGETLRKFKVIVKFCISVFFKQYFEIKGKHHIKYGPGHIDFSLDLLQKQTPEVEDIVTPVIQRGAYHANSQSVLTSLFSSENEEDRSFALEKII